MENIITEQTDHTDPAINSLIKILKKNSENRSSTDLFEIGRFLKNFSIFKEFGIEGRDRSDIGEFITYQFFEEDDVIIEAGSQSDYLYLIIDGAVEFTSDIFKNPLTGK